MVDVIVVMLFILKFFVFGVDFVMYLVIKVFNGYLDFLGGVIIINDVLFDVWIFFIEECKFVGVVMGLFEVWLLLCGLRILVLWVECMNWNV